MRRGFHVPTIYLSGPMDDCSLAERTEWRQYIKTQQFYPMAFDVDQAVKFHVYDPCDRVYSSDETEVAYRQIVEDDLLEIHRSDALLAKFMPGKIMVGTLMEIKHAFDHGKLVVVMVPLDYRISPWLRYFSHKIIKTRTPENDALDYILKKVT